MILLVAVFAVATSTGGSSGDTGSFTPNDDGLVPVGTEAPEFTTETVEGGSVSLGETGEHEATLLAFFATWCPFCQEEAPDIADFESQYEDLRVVMVSVADENWPEQDTPEEVGEFVDEYGIEGPAAYDPELAQDYGVTGTPTNYVLDGDGEVVGAHTGEAPRAVYEGWIQEALES